MVKTNKRFKKISLFKTAILIIAAFALAIAPFQQSYADSYDDQIRALKQQIAGYQDQASQLRAEADTLQNKVNALNAEKLRLQSEINLNTAKVAQLEQQIIETQQKIEQQKVLLGNSLVNLYLDGSVTPLEVLASSKSVSDYIDKQEYRDTIRASLQDSIAQVKKLQADLNQQKKDTENALADQKTQRDELAAKEQEQAILLAQTQGQEAAYQNMVKQSNSQIANLRAQQAAANLKWGGAVNFETAGGGYPAKWANAPLDAYADDWGMYTRECTSFGAFKVAVSGRYMPYGLGNAIQWPSGARARGIPVDTNPQDGDVAIWPVGYYGHVMYVYSVNSDGSLYIGEYNYDWTGRYSERTISRATWQAQGFQFIHF
ncbi:MAG TPA: CHAP domain-containing protein [Magnetospirillaceae bacterium]|nr:CHAP domain-containing protein [Magnetospirillaceae bacterium]